MLRGARVLLPLLVWLVVMAGGCATTERRSVRSKVAPSASQLGSWADLKQIGRVFARVPPELSPGLAALAADVEALRRRVEREGGFDFAAVDPTALVTRNPHYWQAAMELAPGDPLIDYLGAVAWGSAGYPWRCRWQLNNLTLTAALPRAVLNFAWFRMGQINVEEVAAGLNPEGLQTLLVRPAAERAERLQALALRHPHHPVVAWELIVARRELAGLPPPGSDDARQMPAALVADLAPQVALLQQLYPMQLAALNPDPAARAEVERRLGQRHEALDLELALGVRDLEQLADAFAALGLPDQALLARRRVAAARGFPVPADAQAWERGLTALLGDAAEPLLVRLRTGFPQVWFYLPRPPEAPSTPWRPIHPLLVQRGMHRLAVSRLALEHPESGPEAMSDAYARRAMAAWQLADWAGAEADLNRLAVLEPTAAAWMAVELALEQQQAEAARALWGRVDWNQIDPYLARQLEAKLAALEGRWSDAAAAYDAVTQMTQLDGEARAFAALHAAAARQFAGEDVGPDLRAARSWTEEGSWINELLNVVLNPGQADQILARAAEGWEVTQAGRRCEAHFARALAPGVTAEQRRIELRRCVESGVVDFYEYSLARAWLRLDEPERWSEPVAPTPAPPPDSEDESAPRSLEEAQPNWALPA